MPAPLKPHLYPVVLHDTNANPIGPDFPIHVIVVPGTEIDTPADTSVTASTTVALPTPPDGTTRMTVQVTDGNADTTRIRVREAGGIAGAGRVLKLLGSTMYGGDGGSIAPLEVENVAGPTAAVSISFEVL